MGYDEVVASDVPPRSGDENDAADFNEQQITLLSKRKLIFESAASNNGANFVIKAISEPKPAVGKLQHSYCPESSESATMITE